MNDESFIARMNFTIGRVYSLKQDYDTAIYFHEKHLNLARQLHDSIGQCRAYYFLSQLNEKINQYDKAKKYESLYKALAREVILHNDNNFFAYRIFRLINPSMIQFPFRHDQDQRIICSRFEHVFEETILHSIVLESTY